MDAYNAFNMTDPYYREMIEIEEEKVRSAQEHRRFMK
jgi:hypothetical protein